MMFCALGKARGSILEVGVGTGINLPLYKWQDVRTLVGLDLSRGMLEEAQQRIHAQLQGLPIDLIQGDAEALPFAAGVFDCVVDTFSLCVMEHPGQALREVARVLRPGGRALLLEHSRSAVGLLGAYQDLTAALVKATSKGCAWNQNIVEMVEAAGLKPTRIQPVLSGLVMLVEAHT